MIVTALLLIAVGTTDVIRQAFGARRASAPVPNSAAQDHAAPSHAAPNHANLPRRITLAAAAVAILLLSIAAGAWPGGVLAVACAAAWIWLMPTDAPARAGIWPAVALAILAGAFIALLGSRADVGLLGSVWSMSSPWGALSLDATLLVIGVVLFLLESANLVVRAALTHEMATDATATPTTNPKAAASPTLKGGRLIGPLERLLVFALTLSGMYTLLAAVLAAKGIVRFPEISRDRDAGNRAEYFLVGSLVSWVIALAAAFLVWWGFATPGV